jgi:hypothetical protein
VAGYATTASISLGTFSYFGSDQVQVVITALHTNGSTNTYQGTYTGHLAAFDSITQQDLAA